MPIRFSLKTLLVTIAVVSTVAGFSLNQIMNVARERGAVEQLKSDWFFNEAMGRPRTSSLGWIERYSGWVDARISGAENLPRLRQLELIPKSTEKIGTMGQLPKLKYVSQLTLRKGTFGVFQIGIEPNIDANEFRFIRKMRSLRELGIEYPVSESVVRELNSRRLETLELKGGDWSQAVFDEIGKMRSLRKLNLKADQFDAESLKAISRLKRLTFLTLWTNDGYVTERSPDARETSKGDPSTIDVGLIGDLPELKWLSINGHVGPEAIRSMANLKRLETLDLEFTDVDDSYLDELLQLPTRPNLQFGKLQISVATFDALENAGFIVTHDGLIQSLDSNFLRYGGVDYPVLPIGNQLNARMRAADDFVTWSFRLSLSRQRDRQLGTMPKYWSPGFEVQSDWIALAGQSFDSSYKTGLRPKFGGGSLQLGDSSCAANHHRVRFISRAGNQFRVQGSFKPELAGNGTAEFDANLTFQYVEVETGAGGSAASAVEIFRRYFDPADFEPPSPYAGLIRFRLKQSRMSGLESE